MNLKSRNLLIIVTKESMLLLLILELIS